ncbi:MAG: SH3 domain-containing protein [Hyphomicrobiaceae bacterium]
MKRGWLATLTMLLALAGSATPGWSKGCLIAGELRNDIADADCEEAQTTGCISHLLSTTQYRNCIKAQPRGKLNQLCSNYGVRMLDILMDAYDLGCDFAKNAELSTIPFVKRCKVDPRIVKLNIRIYERNLSECKQSKGGDGAGGQTAKVVKDVDVYDAPGGKGKRTGSLNAGTTVGFEGCDGDWCHVTGGKVPNGDGYVYNGADYRSLKL